MKAIELRVGNKVLYNQYYESVVTGVTEENGIFLRVPSQHSRIGCVEECVSGIILTEDWLKRFGFDCRDGEISNKWHIGINEITHDWLFDLVWLKGGDSNYGDYPFYRNGKFMIKSVNQLQNLFFALTGEELTEREQQP